MRYCYLEAYVSTTRFIHWWALVCRYAMFAEQIFADHIGRWILRCRLLQLYGHQTWSNELGRGPHKFSPILDECVSGVKTAFGIQNSATLNEIPLKQLLLGGSNWTTEWLFIAFRCLWPKQKAWLNPFRNTKKTSRSSIRSPESPLSSPFKDEGRPVSTRSPRLGRVA